VPQLIVPLAFDQPDNARRAVALGLARTFSFKKVTADLLASELDTLLTHDDYIHAAQKVAKGLVNKDGSACAADDLIACALLSGATP
jgi:UDP:flavonoid glycosyltransferase YjiC (YdhE family)